MNIILCYSYFSVVSLCRRINCNCGNSPTFVLQNSELLRQNFAVQRFANCHIDRLFFDQVKPSPHTCVPVCLGHFFSFYLACSLFLALFMDTLSYFTLISWLLFFLKPNYQFSWRCGIGMLYIYIYIKYIVIRIC